MDGRLYPWSLKTPLHETVPRSLGPRHQPTIAAPPRVYIHSRRFCSCSRTLTDFSSIPQWLVTWWSDIVSSCQPIGVPWTYQKVWWLIKHHSLKKIDEAFGIQSTYCIPSMNSSCLFWNPINKHPLKILRGAAFITTYVDNRSNFYRSKLLGRNITPRIGLDWYVHVVGISRNYSRGPFLEGCVHPSALGCFWCGGPSSRSRCKWIVNTTHSQSLALIEVVPAMCTTDKSISIQ